MAIDTLIINPNPQAMACHQGLRFTNYPSFLAWVARHWHDSQALQHAQWLISPFVAMAHHGRPGAETWRTANWMVPEDVDGASQAPVQPPALRWLTEAAAVRLLKVTPPGDELNLAGLTELDAATAIVLASHPGGLNLSGLTELTPDVSTALAKHLGLIRLDGLKSIGGSLAPLVRRRGPRGQAQPGLSLGGLPKLDAVGADLLAQIQGDLLLNGLRDLNAQQAQWLAQRQGDRDKRLGTLHLDAWQHPSPEVLSALAAYKGSLSLGAWVPPVEGAPLHWEALAKAPRDSLMLGAIRTLTEPNARALAKLQLKRLSLPAIASLDATTVEHLGPMVLLTLALDGVKSAPLPLIRRLVQLQDKNISGLSLAGLEVSPEIRAELEKHSNLKAPDLASAASPH